MKPRLNIKVGAKGATSSTEKTTQSNKVKPAINV